MEATLWVTVGVDRSSCWPSRRSSRGSETALTAVVAPAHARAGAPGQCSGAAIVNGLLAPQGEPDRRAAARQQRASISCASALATSVLIELFGNTGVVYATVGMTVMC